MGGGDGKRERPGSSEGREVGGGEAKRARGSGTGGAEVAVAGDAAVPDMGGPCQWSCTAGVKLDKRAKRYEADEGVDWVALAGWGSEDSARAAVLQDLEKAGAHKSRASKESELGRVDVFVGSEYLTTGNPLVRRRRVWGTGRYLGESDLVAVLMHSGVYVPCSTPPPFKGVHVLVTVLPPAEGGYASSTRFGLRSRAWGGAGVRELAEGTRKGHLLLPGGGEAKQEKRAAAVKDKDKAAEEVKAKLPVSIEVERAYAVRSDGSCFPLRPGAMRAHTAVPTFVPATTERVITTRSTSATAVNRQRFVKEITVQYNLCNEPWLKYALSLVTDRGLDPKLWTSYRLRSEVLFLESTTQRFELSRCPPADQGGGKRNSGPDKYILKLCNAPLEGRQLRELGVPLPPAHVQDVSGPLDWEEFGLCTDGLLVGGKYYALERLCWVPTGSRDGSDSDASESDAEDSEGADKSDLEEDIEGKDEVGDDAPKNLENLGEEDSSDAEDGDARKGNDEKGEHGARALFGRNSLATPSPMYTSDEEGGSEKEEEEEEALDEDDLDLEPLDEGMDMDADED